MQNPPWLSPHSAGGGGGGDGGGGGGGEDDGGEKDDAHAWSECPSELSDHEGELLSELGGLVRRSHHPDCVFDLEYNYPELIGHAFDCTAAKLLGDDDHGLKLELLRGGSPAPSADAVELAMFLSYGSAKLKNVCVFHRHALL